MNLPSISRVQTSAKQLAPRIQANESPVTSVGAVAKVGDFKMVATALKPFKVALTSASGASKNFIIGDPSGILATLIGGTIASPDSASCLVAGMKASFAYAPVVIKAINYKVTSSATQFDNTFNIVTGDIDGNINQRPVNVAAYERNNQYNAKLMTFEFKPGEEFIFAWNTALYIVVNDGEDVYLSFTPAAAANRY